MNARSGAWDKSERNDLRAADRLVVRDRLDDLHAANAVPSWTRGRRSAAVRIQASPAGLYGGATPHPHRGTGACATVCAPG
jgi:hypothetical protein